MNNQNCIVKKKIYAAPITINNGGKCEFEQQQA